MNNLDRITNPLRLAAGSYQEGSGKGCAMNVISYINGDTEITDFPRCSAQPLSRLVQTLNDDLAGEDGFLSPEDSIRVLALGWKTVGTSGVPKSVERLWVAEILDSPEFGLVRFLDESLKDTARALASLHRRKAKGDRVDEFEWINLDSVLSSAKDCVLINTFKQYELRRACSYASISSPVMSIIVSSYNRTACELILKEMKSEYVEQLIDSWRRIAGMDNLVVDVDKTDAALTKMYQKA